MKTTFEQWLRARHLKDCAQCQKEGKARLVDTNAYALMLYQEWQKSLAKT